MMEEYTDICSLLGLDTTEAGLHDKQTIIEETLSDPSDLLDFLVSQEFREDCGYRASYSASLLSNLNIDINLNINGRRSLPDCQQINIQIITLFFQTCHTLIDLAWPGWTRAVEPLT